MTDLVSTPTLPGFTPPMFAKSASTTQGGVLSFAPKMSEWGSQLFTDVMVVLPGADKVVGAHKVRPLPLIYRGRPVSNAYFGWCAGDFGLEVRLFQQHVYQPGLSRDDNGPGGTAGMCGYG